MSNYLEVDYNSDDVRATSRKRHKKMKDMTKDAYKGRNEVMRETHKKYLQKLEDDLQSSRECFQSEYEIFP